MRYPLCLTLAFTMLLSMHLYAEELKLSTEKKDVPEGIAEEIAETLSEEAVILGTDFGALYEIWFTKELALSKKPESNDDALDAVDEMTLFGAFVAHAEKRDYRDDELYEDTYTMRYAIQPQDGNHLGTSVYNYFVVLLAASTDETLEGFADVEEMIQVSSDNTAVGHPMILSLRPVKKIDGEYPSLEEPAEHHKTVRVKLKGKVKDSGEEVDIVFDLVYEGVGEI